MKGRLWVWVKRKYLYQLQIEGGKVETVAGFIFSGSQNTTDVDYSYGIKRRLLLGRKAMTSLDSILKSRDITLQTTVYRVKAMVFPVVAYRCEIVVDVQLLHWVWLLMTSWTAAHQASLSPTISLGLSKFMSTGSVMPSHPLTPSWITALSWQKDFHDSLKLWAVPCRAIHEGRVIVESSDKM